MKKKLWGFFLALILILGGGWYARNAFGVFLWETFRAERAAAFLYSGNAPLLLQIGNHYFNTDGEGAYDLMRAEYYFTKALAADSSVPDAWHQLARIDFLRGNFVTARSKIDTQIALHGDSLMSSYYIRGLIAGFQKDYGQAEKDFKRFLVWDPKNWAAHNDLAWIYFEQGKFEEAADIAHDGLRYGPQNPWLLTARGVALMNLGNKPEALALLSSARYYAHNLTADNWERAYPGNDPAIASFALREMQKSIAHNLALIVDN